jgi:hypothetical protein
MAEQREYRRILIKNGRCTDLENILKIFLFQKTRFPAACLDNLQPCLNTSYRKFVSPVRHASTKYSITDRCPDMRWPIRTPPPRKLFMAYFRVFRTCLKGLLGNVSSRILVENSIVLREGLLGINVYMYPS